VGLQSDGETTGRALDVGRCARGCEPERHAFE
jgi:hypothetical protein